MTAQQAEKLGYLGLGMMGFPMARRLINAGHDVSVWNRSTGKAASLVEAGAKLKAHPREVADSAAVLFMCVTDAAAVEEVVFGGDGLGCRFFLNPPGRSARYRCSTEGSQWDGMGRRPGVRRHQGRRRRHACGHGGRRCR